jgi:hypothetical protein
MTSRASEELSGGVLDSCSDVHHPSDFEELGPELLDSYAEEQSLGDADEIPRVPRDLKTLTMTERLACTASDWDLIIRAQDWPTCYDSRSSSFATDGKKGSSQVAHRIILEAPKHCGSLSHNIPNPLRKLPLALSTSTLLFRISQHTPNSNSHT